MREIIRENHYGKYTWTHKEMDELRKTECLCRLCALRHTGFCPAANKLFEVYKEDGIALAVTRCAGFIAECTEA